MAKVPMSEPQRDPLELLPARTDYLGTVGNETREAVLIRVHTSISFSESLNLF